MCASRYKAECDEYKTDGGGSSPEDPSEISNNGIKRLNTMPASRVNLAILKPKGRFVHIANAANELQQQGAIQMGRMWSNSGLRKPSGAAVASG